MFHLLGRKNKRVRVYAPIQGSIVSLDEIVDPVFSQRLVGEGIAIKSNSGTVYAPVDGTIQWAMRSKHAISIQTKHNAVILIHIGLQTDSSKSESYTPLVPNGTNVKAGDEILHFSPNEYEGQNNHVMIPVILLDSQFYQMSKVKTSGSATQKKTILFEFK